MLVGGILKRKLPREVGNRDLRHRTLFQDAVDFFHRPVVIRQMLQAMQDADFIDGLILERPRVEIQIANQVDVRRLPILVDVGKPHDRFCA